MRPIRLTAMLAMLATIPLLAIPVQAGDRPSATVRRDAGTPGGWAPGRLLVQPKGGVSAAELRALFNQHGLLRLGRLHRINVHFLALPESRVAAVEAALRADPRIRSVERDWLVPPALQPNDPDFSQAYHLARIGCPIAWNTTTGATAAPIAILDSGVDATHPDLAGKLVPGYNVFDNNSDTTDVYGHGTMVAGTAAAASNNGIGVTSIAWKNPIMPIRVTDTAGNAYVSTLSAGLMWAADHGARVANMSFAVFGAAFLNSAAQYFISKGGVVFAAAGNDALLHSDEANPYVVSVAATDQNDLLAGFSSSGPYVDLAAPGVAIVTTTRGGGYGFASGTSFASPIAAGVAGLLFGVNPALTPTQITDLLTANARDLGPSGYDPSCGWGRVDAANTVAAAHLSLTGPDTTPPVVTIAAPVTGASVSGVVTVKVDAQDDVAINRVVLFADGRMVGTDATAPYEFAWTVSGLLPGSHALMARAYDTAGNRADSSALAVTVIDTVPPTVRLTAPAANRVVSRMLTIAATATDNVGIKSVTFLVDGVAIGTDGVPPYGIAWSTTTVANGTHTLSARATDRSGNLATASLVVTVRNALPTVRLTAPAANRVVSGTVTVGAATSTNVGIKSVSFFADGVAIGSDSTPAYGIAWSTATVANGTHTLSARAADRSGNLATASVTVTVRNALR